MPVHEINIHWRSRNNRTGVATITIRGIKVTTKDVDRGVGKWWKRNRTKTVMRVEPIGAFN